MASWIKATIKAGHIKVERSSSRHLRFSVDVKDRHVEVKDRHVEVKDRQVDVKHRQVDVKHRQVDVKHRQIDVKLSPNRQLNL